MRKKMAYNRCDIHSGIGDFELTGKNMEIIRTIFPQKVLQLANFWVLSVLLTRQKH